MCDIFCFIENNFLLFTIYHLIYYYKLFIHANSVMIVHLWFHFVCQSLFDTYCYIDMYVVVTDLPFCVISVQVFFNIYLLI